MARDRISRTDVRSKTPIRNEWHTIELAIIVNDYNELIETTMKELELLLNEQDLKKEKGESNE